MPFESRDIFKRPLVREELQALARQAGGVGSIVSWRSPTARRLGLGQDDTPDERLIDLMAGEPRMIRRPILVADGEIIVGADPKSLEAALGTR